MNGAFAPPTKVAVAMASTRVAASLAWLLVPALHPPVIQLVLLASVLLAIISNAWRQLGINRQSVLYMLLSAVWTCNVGCGGQKLVYMFAGCA